MFLCVRWFLMTFLAGASVKAGAPPFDKEFTRECGQGQRLFTVLKFTKETADEEMPDDLSKFLLPRCIGFEPSACVRVSLGRAHCGGGQRF